MKSKKGLMLVSALLIAVIMASCAVYDPTTIPDPELDFTAVATVDGIDFKIDILNVLDVNQDYGGRVVFEYTLADASGNVLTSGQVQMSPSIKDVGVIYGTASGASFGDEIICNGTFSIDGYSTSETVNTTVV